MKTFNEKLDEILDWNIHMMLKQAILQNISETKKLHLTEEIITTEKANAHQAIIELICEDVIGGDRPVIGALSAGAAIQIDIENQLRNNLINIVRWK